MIWTLGNSLRGFDLVVFFGYSRPMRLWLRSVTGAPMRSGADSPLGGWETAAGFSGRPAALAYAGIAGVAPQGLIPLFPLHDEEISEAAALSGGEPYAVVAPGGGRNPRQDVPEKRWSPEGWGDVVSHLRSRGLRVVGVGGHSDRNLCVTARVDVNLAGTCSWGVTASLIARAAVFAGTDSGPAHLAVAHGTPSVVVFGPTDPSALYPPGSVIPVTPGVQCSPCYSNGIFPGCRQGFACMRSIESRQVIEALKQVAL